MESICKQCHLSGKGCCLFKTNDNYLAIGIFHDDIVKIETHTGQPKSDFIITEKISNETIMSLSKSIHPIFEKVYLNGFNHRLRTINNRCVFLSIEGCTLHEEIRPVYCRMYPFFPSVDYTSINVLTSYNCMAQAQSTLNWEIVNKHFGYRKEYLFDLFELFRLYAENHRS